LSLFAYFLAQMFCLSDDDDPKETATAIPRSSASTAVENNSQKEIVVETPREDTLEKILKAPSVKRRKKTTQTVSVSLEAHQTASSSSDVSTPCAILYDMMQ
jgi:hypothetical protein